MANALKKIRKKTNVCLLFLFLSCLLEMMGIAGLQGHSFMYFPDLPFCSTSFKERSVHVRCCCLIFVFPPLCKYASVLVKQASLLSVCFYFGLFGVLFVLSRQGLTMYSPNCPRTKTHCVDQAGLELREPPASTS